MQPKQSVTLTSMLAIPVTPAVGKSWRITEKAPPPQPSKSVKRGVLPETCSSQTIKRGKAVLEPSSNPERVTPVKHDE